jgi:hypothetical protein
MVTGTTSASYFIAIRMNDVEKGWSRYRFVKLLLLAFVPSGETKTGMFLSRRYA